MQVDGELQKASARFKPFGVGLLLLVSLLATSLNTRISRAQSPVGFYDDPVQLGRIAYYSQSGTPMYAFYQWGPNYAGGSCFICINQTRSVSYLNGESAAMYFRGDSITVWSSMFYNRAPKRIRIFSGFNGTNTGSPWYDQVWSYYSGDVAILQVARTVVMPAGSYLPPLVFGNSDYTIWITNVGSGYSPNPLAYSAQGCCGIIPGDNDVMDLDALEVEGPRLYSVGSTPYNVEGPGGIQYVNILSAWSTNLAGQGGKETGDRLNSATSRSNGESISAVFNAGPDKGLVKVILDGNSKLDSRYIDLYRPVPTRVGTTFYHFLAGANQGGFPVTPRYEQIHNITIQPLGDRNPSSAAATVSLHAVDTGYLGAGMFSSLDGSLRRTILNWNYSGSSYKSIFANSAATWSAATNLSLNEWPGSPFALDIYVIEEINPEFFNTNGVPNAIALTFPNGGTNFDDVYNSCTLHINNTRIRNLNFTSAQVTYTMLHELGHCFSLAHLSDPGSAMYQPASGTPTTAAPNSNDIKRINDRYY